MWVNKNQPARYKCFKHIQRKECEECNGPNCVIIFLIVSVVSIVQLTK